MKRGTARQLAMGLVVAVMGSMVWAGAAEAWWPFFRTKHKLKHCRADLSACDANLGQCDAELAQCEAEAQTFPGDGYPDTDSFGTPGHGPQLDYTDNGSP